MALLSFDGQVLGGIYEESWLLAALEQIWEGRAEQIFQTCAFLCSHDVWGVWSLGGKAKPMLHNLQVGYVYFWHLANPTAPLLLKPRDQGCCATAHSLHRKYCEPLTFSTYVQPRGPCYAGQAAHQLLAKLCNINVGQLFFSGGKKKYLRNLCPYNKHIHENSE